MSSNFFKSFQPLLKKSKKYLLEIILLTIAVFITIIAVFLYGRSGKPDVGIGLDRSSTKNSRIPPSTPAKIYVDLSGAIKKPNVYQVRIGTRINEVIDKAGGLSTDADVMFFNRNFNLARFITDQEKIYIPSTMEINEGIFVQNQQTLDYISPNTGDRNITDTIDTQTNNQLINLNSATIEELDQLPGIGQVTANKIIDNRPYSTIDELLIKKAVNKNVFEKIKNLISIN